MSKRGECCIDLEKLKTLYVEDGLSGSISRTYRRIAFKHHPNECYHCKTKDNLEVHHINRNRKDNNPNNLRIVCQSCHRLIEHKDLYETPKEEKPEEPKVAIMGTSIATAQQMAQYLLSHNSDPKIKITALEFAELFLEEGAREGVRGDIAFCQSMHETGWLKYGGQVLPEQNNYAGIGATSNSPVGKGAWFKDEREGVRAQIQHLKAYASKEPLTTECVDPRFHLVTRGVAPNWTDLNGRWAYPGTNYGQSILAKYEELMKVKVEVPEPSKEDERVKVLEKHIKDLTAERDELKNQLAQSNRKLADIKNILN